MKTQAIPADLRLWRLVGIVNMPAFLIGGLAAVAGQRWGAYVLIANLCLQVGSHVVVGFSAHRRVMTRPWPKVAPLEDDEDWDE